MKQIELTSKLVLAIIALTSVSAILVPTYAAPSIRSADIVNGEVRTEDLANGAVTNAKIANGAVTTTKISDTNGVQSGDIVDGTIQEQDIADGVIPSGGQLEVHRVHGDAITLGPNEASTARVDCPSGEILTGGGFNGGYFNTHVINSSPLDADTWIVVVYNEGPADAQMDAVALCIDPGEP
jgi:hypothetical protein